MHRPDLHQPCEDIWGKRGYAWAGKRCPTLAPSAVVRPFQREKWRPRWYALFNEKSGGRGVHTGRCGAAGGQLREGLPRVPTLEPVLSDVWLVGQGASWPGGAAHPGHSTQNVCQTRHQLMVLGKRPASYRGGACDAQACIPLRWCAAACEPMPGVAETKLYHQSYSLSSSTQHVDPTLRPCQFLS